MSFIVNAVSFPLSTGCLSRSFVVRKHPTGLLAQSDWSSMPRGGGNGEGTHSSAEQPTTSTEPTNTTRRKTTNVLVRENTTAKEGNENDDVSSISLVVADNGGFVLLSDTVLYEKWRRLVSRRVQLPSGRTVDFEIVGQASPPTTRISNNAATLQRGASGSSRRASAAAPMDEAVLVFVWHRSTQTTTLIREYMPSVHRKLFGLAAGMVEVDKHHQFSITGSNDSTRLRHFRRMEENLPCAHKTNNNHTSYDHGNDVLSFAAAQWELAEECRLTGGEWILCTPAAVTMDKYSTTALTVYLVLDPVPLTPAQEEWRPRDAAEEGVEIVPNVTVTELIQRIRNAELTTVGAWAALLALQELRDMGEIIPQESLESD